MRRIKIIALHVFTPKAASVLVREHANVCASTCKDEPRLAGVPARINQPDGAHGVRERARNSLDEFKGTHFLGKAVAEDGFCATPINRCFII